MSRGSPSQRRMEGGGTLNRSSVVDPETFYQQYEAIKEDYEALRKRFVDLNASHCLSQEEINRLKKLYEDALQETSNAIRERNALQHQCTQVIRQWDSTLTERNEYKDALGKVQQQHEETMKEVNQAMAAKIKYTKDIKRLTEEREAAKIKYTKDIKRLIEERDAANQEYALVMSERDSVHRELEKLTDDLGGSKKQIKNLETLNKELKDKIAEALQEAEVAKRRRDWAFSEREKIVRERESLRTLCDRLRRERDRAVSDLAEALSESEDIRKQKNLASKQLKELRDKVEFDKENHSIFVHQYLSNSSSFSESRDSAIDSDMPSGHYSIKLPNVRGADHGLVLEPGVYISRILPGSPAAKEMNLNVGDRVLFINDAPIDNVQDAILALSEDIDPIVLTLSRSAGHLASPISANNTQNSNNNKNKNQQTQSKASAHASSSSLRSDKSDPNSMLSEGRRHGGGGGKSASGGLRDIFRVRLPRKKHSSPEEAIALATLDSAIETGGTSRKIRQKRERASSRNSGSENINKNGTWPRVVMSRNSACSYTLPQDVPVGPISNARGLPDNTSTNHHSRDSSYYGQYAPVTLSNTVCVRRPVSGKERVPVQDMMKWDWACPQPSKSVGTIAMSGGGNNIFGGGPNSMGMSKGLTPSGRPMTMGGLESHGLPAPVQHHRYSFGVFDPNHTLGSSKLKGALERNSVVPTMSDGSSIDFSVKSGNMDLQYYVNKMAKNQNNSSESDHLDKVITPPSLALSNVPVKSSTASNLLGHPSGVSGLSVTSTLDRFQNRYSSPYTGHHHDILGGGPLSSSNSSGTIPLSLPKHNNNSYSFEPPLYHSHSHGTNDYSTSMSLGSSGHRINFRNSDDLLLQPSYPIESSGTFPRNREPQRIRIPSNQSVTSRNSTEKYEIRNSPVPAFHIQIIDPGDGSSTGGSSDFTKWKKLAPGALRMVRVDRYDKTREFLGINIDHNGGVFVKTVNKNSLASEIGLQIGDQLLEVCGINMRNATQEQAEKILREAGDPLTLLVQFSPDKYYGHEEIYHRASSSDDSHSDGESSSSPDNDDDNHSSTSGSRSGSRSGSPTPCNSPQSTLVRNSKKNSSVHNAHPMAGSSGVANLLRTNFS